MLLSAPPTSIADLMHRVDTIAGWTLGELAAKFGQVIPENLLHHKGWVGQLLEKVLGADAGNRAIPDFTALHIELKTIPINSQGKPQESTYIAVVPLLGYPDLSWKTSEVRGKLRQVLWVPIEGRGDKPIARRRVGQGLLWFMSPQVEAILQTDWQELMEYVLLGKLAHITGRMGQYLHIRPKAANSRSLTYGIGPEGDIHPTLPRGFYLRTQLTEQILAQKC